jgi:hypothetical protein
LRFAGRFEQLGMTNPPQGQRPPPEKPILRYGDWIEGLPYFLLGTVTAAVGLVTAAFWAVEQWRIGNHQRLVLAAIVMSMLVSTLVIPTRRLSPVPGKHERHAFPQPAPIALGSHLRRRVPDALLCICHRAASTRQHHFET